MVFSLGVAPATVRGITSVSAVVFSGTTAHLPSRISGPPVLGLLVYFSVPSALNSIRNSPASLVPAQLPTSFSFRSAPGSAAVGAGVGSACFFRRTWMFGDALYLSGVLI